MQLEDKSFRKLKKSTWCRFKTKEIYGQKKTQNMYSIHGTVGSISFAQRYLCNEVE